MKIFDLQAAPITISCYNCGKIEAGNIGRLLLDPVMTIMINLEDTLLIATILEKRCTIAFESVAACCSHLCTACMEYYPWTVFFGKR